MSPHPSSTDALSAYEAFMAEQTLTFPSLKDSEGDGFPPVSLVFDQQPQVSQHTLWLNYWIANVAVFDQHPQVLPGLMARVYRMYPSLVREHHLYLLLEEHGRFDLVLRERKLDANGVDYLVLQDGRAYGVQAYVDTPRSRMFRTRKRTRHKALGQTIELPLDMEGAEKVGPFAVYGHQHLDHIWSIVGGGAEQKAA
ncbi:MAG: hypothetical protein HYX52_05835 [Chloroflexi bacterium]|nr:hypothetical protein [Chloroflexota bacterium]